MRMQVSVLVLALAAASCVVGEFNDLRYVVLRQGIELVELKRLVLRNRNLQSELRNVVVWRESDFVRYVNAMADQERDIESLQMEAKHQRRMIHYISRQITALSRRLRPIIPAPAAWR